MLSCTSKCSLEIRTKGQRVLQVLILKVLRDDGKESDICSKCEGSVFLR